MVLQTEKTKKQLIGELATLHQRVADLEVSELEHKRMEQALREIEERFRQLAENIDQVFWMTDFKKAQIIYVSPAYEQIWGRTCKSLYERPRSSLEAVHPEDRGPVSASFEKLAQGDLVEVEYRIVRPDGSIRWIRDRVFPIRDGSGEVYRVAGLAADITEEKRLRRESEHRLQQIIQADRLAALGEMVAGVAHEINNPNSFITYNIPLLEETWNIFKPILTDYLVSHPDWKKDGLSFDELLQDMHEIIEAIKAGSERINRVVTNLKDFIRLDESVHAKPVQVNAVIEKTLAIVRPQLRKSVKKIDIHLASDLPEIQGHFQKLEQVMVNLLVNAAQAISNRAEGRLSIASRYLGRLRSIVVEIQDNGNGMEREVVNRLFEPFFTTRRDRGGTGLGLSVSHGLVREHNGIIGVLSRPGLGSRFTVFLPVDRDVELDLHPTILCVDDNVAVLNMLKSLFLKVQDDFIETTSDPETVVAYLEEHPEVDMLLSDIMMPGMNGWELLEKIKTRFPLLPVILYSGYPQELQKRAHRAIQPDYLLQKPFKTNQLLQIIDSIGRQRL